MSKIAVAFLIEANRLDSGSVIVSIFRTVRINLTKFGGCAVWHRRLYPERVRLFDL